MRRESNVLLTMLLGGLWHGASWTFVAWGGLHGILLVVHHGWQKITAVSGWRPARSRVVAAFWVAITFVCVVVAWVLFRAVTFDAAASVLAGMAGMNGVSVPRTLAETSLAPWLKGAAFAGAFEGVPALGTFSAIPVLGWIAAGLAIVWLLPNSQQWIGLGDDKPRGEQRSRFAWRPMPVVAMAMGMLLAAVLLNLSRVSTFLYYQF